MMYSSKAKVCGILANPVEHSLSPLLQNTFAEYYKKDFVYVPLLVKEKLSTAIKGAFAMNFAGMNVSVPYKVEVIDDLMEVDEIAKKIGAVNTLVKTQFGYKGYNTDMDGLRLSLKKKQIHLNGKHVLIFGAGGASKAVLYLSRFMGAASITLVNRDLEKAKKILDDMWMEADIVELGALNQNPRSLLEQNKYIAFQCTKVGMFPNVTDCIITNKEMFDYIEVGVDLIYTPMQTMFLKECDKRGCTTLNGLDMLIYQGLLSFKLWNNDIEPNEDIVAYVRNLLEKRLRS